MYFNYLVQGVQRLFGCNQCRLSFLEVFSTVSLFDGNLNVDLVNLDLLLIRTCLLLRDLLRFNSDNFDQFIGLK